MHANLSEDKREESELLVRWSLNENQLAKLHPVRGTKSDRERAPRDPPATLKHLEHLCCFKFFLHLSLDILCEE